MTMCDPYATIAKRMLTEDLNCIEIFNASCINQPAAWDKQETAY